MFATKTILGRVGLAHVLPVLASVAPKRSVASSIHALGSNVDEIRRLASTRGGSSFELHLIALVPALSAIVESQRSYPVLHHFHTKDRHAALPLALSMLVEFLRTDLDEFDSVDATVTEPLCRAIHNLLGALTRMGLEEHASSDLMDVASTQSVGINTLADDSHDDRSDMLESHEDDPSVLGRTRLPSMQWLDTYRRFDGWA